MSKATVPELSRWGSGIKTKGLRVNILIAILNISIIFFLAVSFRRKYHSGSTLIYWSAFAVRVMAALAVGLLYFYYYKAGGDTWLFFSDAKQLAHLARANFSDYLKFFWNSTQDITLLEELVTAEARSAIFVKLISILCLLTNDNYWICVLYLALLSFTTSWYLFTKINQAYPDASLAASLAILFFPSVVFWGSGMEKETIALGAIYFVSGVFISVVKAQRVSVIAWLGTIISLLMAWSLKYYWIAIFFPVILTSSIIKLATDRFSLIGKKIFLFWLLFLLLLILTATLSHPNFYLNDLLQVVTMNNQEFMAISRPEGVIHYHNLQPVWSSIVMNAPWALFSGLLRPFLWEAHGLTGILAAIENSCIFILSLAAIYGAIRRRQTVTLLLLAVIAYTTILCVFLALSTPNFGTLSRYRVGFLPFLMFVIAYHNPLIAYWQRRIGLGSR